MAGMGDSVTRPPPARRSSAAPIDACCTMLTGVVVGVVGAGGRPYMGGNWIRPWCPTE